MPVIEIHVRDEADQPLSGASIRRSVEGEQDVDVPCIDGEARVEVSELASTTTLLAVHQGVTQEIELPAGVTAYTFRFTGVSKLDDPTAPRPATPDDDEEPEEPEEPEPDAPPAAEEPEPEAPEPEVPEPSDAAPGPSETPQPRPRGSGEGPAWMRLVIPLVVVVAVTVVAIVMLWPDDDPPKPEKTQCIEQVLTEQAGLSTEESKSLSGRIAEAKEGALVLGKDQKSYKKYRALSDDTIKHALDKCTETRFSDVRLKVEIGVTVLAKNAAVSGATVTAGVPTVRPCHTDPTGYCELKLEPESGESLPPLTASHPGWGAGKSSRVLVEEAMNNGIKIDLERLPTLKIVIRDPESNKVNWLTSLKIEPEWADGAELIGETGKCAFDKATPCPLEVSPGLDGEVSYSFRGTLESVVVRVSQGPKEWKSDRISVSDRPLDFCLDQSKVGHLPQECPEPPVTTGGTGGTGTTGDGGTTGTPPPRCTRATASCPAAIRTVLQQRLLDQLTNITNDPVILYACTDGTVRIRGEGAGALDSTRTNRLTGSVNPSPSRACRVRWPL